MSFSLRMFDPNIHTFTHKAATVVLTVFDVTFLLNMLVFNKTKIEGISIHDESSWGSCLSRITSVKALK